MPIVILLVHFLLLSFLAALIPWKLLPAFPKLATFNGGLKQALVFGIGYTCITYGAVLLVAASGYTPGSTGLLGKTLMNGGWMLGSALCLYLYARTRPKTFNVADSTVHLIGGFILFYTMMLSVAILSGLLLVLGVG